MSVSNSYPNLSPEDRCRRAAKILAIGAWRCAASKDTIDTDDKTASKEAQPEDSGN